jgi:hypothetical protein
MEVSNAQPISLRLAMNGRLWIAFDIVPGFTYVDVPRAVS